MTAASLRRDDALVLAEALSYPDAATPERLRAASARLSGGPSAAARAVADRLAELGAGGAEELYTATFDLAGVVSPYAGEHLCGETGRRNALVAWLAERYAAAGLPAGREVPDHFAELLRYLALAPAGPEAHELAVLALGPAARAAAAALPPGNPYRAVLEAVAGAVEPAAGNPVPEEAGP